MAKAKGSSGKDGPSKGDKVAWRSHGSETTGTVEKKITERPRPARRPGSRDQTTGPKRERSRTGVRGPHG